jgi:enoyl-CoA hydratase/carnithine racemase
MNPDDSPLSIDIQDGVASVVLNRPRSINALSEEMMSALQSALDGIASDSAVRVVILKSSGEHFCAGHNLKEMTEHRSDDDGGNAYYLKLFEACSTMMKSIVRLPQPVIAEVRGIATAAGCQLVASCDLAVAADNARFATSGINIGLFCSTPMVALSRNVAAKHAMEMLLLGEFLSAKRAAEIGLVNSVVPEADLSVTVNEMANTLANKSGSALKLGKEAFYRQLEMPLDEAYAYTGRVISDNMMTRDAEAGIGAFINKQPMPEWSGE